MNRVFVTATAVFMLAVAPATILAYALGNVLHAGPTGHFYLGLVVGCLAMLASLAIADRITH